MLRNELFASASSQYELRGKEIKETVEELVEADRGCEKSHIQSCSQETRISSLKLVFSILGGLGFRNNETWEMGVLKSSVLFPTITQVESPVGWSNWLSP